ncbi:RsiV family protein [Parafrankia elaeagni]|uniref:RsiV family protein n=1 Tax=Parafrankia elaeagni TaxID=222534 RepID=UPI000373EE2D|nr:RsiV family protein [Parafrankia elaeagni]
MLSRQRSSAARSTAVALAGLVLTCAAVLTACGPETGAGAGLSASTAGPTAAPAGPTAAASGPSDGPQPQAAEYQITIRQEEGRIDPEASFRADIPVLSGPDATVVGRVNAAIADYVRGEKAQTAYESLTLTAGNPHVGAHVLALSFGGDRYPPGAAHPAELASGLVFDLRSGARVTIEDVFTSTPAGLRRLESIVRAELDRRFPDGPTGGVTDPDPANYRQFVVNPRGLVVIVAELPYVLGPQSVLAPWDQLDGLVRPELADVLRS